MKSTFRKTASYNYPVELVWRGLGFGSTAEIDPLNEDQYNNTEPAPGTVYTRALEVKANELFSFQMKARGFIATWRIELIPMGECLTKVKLQNTVEYRSADTFIRSLFGLAYRNEINAFAAQLGQRIEDDFKGIKAGTEK